MKIKEYNQMMGYLTRKPTKTELEETKKGPITKKFEKKKLDVLDYVDKVQQIYGEGGSVTTPKHKPHYITNLGTGELEDVNAPDWKSDSRDLQDKRGSRFINKTLKSVEKNDDPRGVAFNPTTQLFTNKNRTVAFKTYDEADTWNKAINVKTKYYPDEATPEQFGKMAARVEMMKQQQGNPTQMKEFVNKFGDSDRSIKKKKKILTTTPVAIDYSYTTPPPPTIAPDPESDRLAANFRKLVEENEKEKARNKNSGIAGLMGGNEK